MLSTIGDHTFFHLTVGPFRDLLGHESSDLSKQFCWSIPNSLFIVPVLWFIRLFFAQGDANFPPERSALGCPGGRPPTIAASEICHFRWRKPPVYPIGSYRTTVIIQTTRPDVEGQGYDILMPATGPRGRGDSAP